VSCFTLQDLETVESLVSIPMGGEIVITRSHCMRFMGQHVVFRTRDGAMHHGILHTVTDGGIYVRPVYGRTTRLASHAGNSDHNIALLLQNSPQTADDIAVVQWPLFFFPFLALAFLAPFAWWW
jgi:hypothetical protein